MESGGQGRRLCQGNGEIQAQRAGLSLSDEVLQLSREAGCKVVVSGLVPDRAQGAVFSGRGPEIWLSEQFFWGSLTGS